LGNFSNPITFQTRRKLGLKTEKRHGNHVVAATEGPKLTRLLEKYGITVEPVPADSGDLGDSAAGMEPAPSAESPG